MKGEVEDEGVDLVDMGQIDEEERPFMIVDKDTGKVYDMRNETHLNRLTNHATTRLSSNVSNTFEPRNPSEKS